MTTWDLDKLKPGAHVVWTRPGEDQCAGTVNKRPDLNCDAPHYVIDWADGQRTDGRDFAALGHVELWYASEPPEAA